MSRFDWRYELQSMWQGMDRDLQQQVGQTIPWYVFDRTNTVVDPIYDVGKDVYDYYPDSTGAPGGRRWKPPVFLPVMNAVKVEASEAQNDRGFYTVDTLHVVFSVDAARKAGLEDIIFSPNNHDLDRIVYENKVFAVDELKVRGILTADYAVCAAECQQVKDEELVNDPDFQQWIRADYQS